MFICNNCLEEKYTNGQSLHRSVGKCEICKSFDACNDIPNSYLKEKEVKIVTMRMILQQPGSKFGSKIILEDCTSLNNVEFYKDFYNLIGEAFYDWLNSANKTTHPQDDSCKIYEKNDVIVMISDINPFYVVYTKKPLDFYSDDLVDQANKDCVVYIPSFLKPKQMNKYGYQLIKIGAPQTAEFGYFTYESISPRGKIIITFNCTYRPKESTLFMCIKNDAGTRTNYYGLCGTRTFLEMILDNIM